MTSWYQGDQYRNMTSLPKFFVKSRDHTQHSRKFWTPKFLQDYRLDPGLWSRDPVPIVGLFWGSLHCEMAAVRPSVGYVMTIWSFCFFKLYWSNSLLDIWSLSLTLHCLKCHEYVLYTDVPSPMSMVVVVSVVNIYAIHENTWPVRAVALRRHAVSHCDWQMETWKSPRVDRNYRSCRPAKCSVNWPYCTTALGQPPWKVRGRAVWSHCSLCVVRVNRRWFIERKLKSVTECLIRSSSKEFSKVFQ